MLGDKGRYEEMRGDARLAPGHGVYTSRTLGFGAGHDSYFPHGGTSRTLGLGAGMGMRTWHRGMSFRFVLFLWRHHQDFRVGGGA